MMVEIRYFLSMMPRLERRNLLLLQILMVTVALSELATLAFVGLFMGLISDMSIIGKPGFLSDIYRLTESTSESDFLLLFGGFGILLIFVNSMASLATVWGLSTFSQRLGAIFASALYSFYIRGSFAFHLDNNSSKLSSNIAQETNRLTNMVVLPALNLLAKLIQMVALVGVIVYLSPGNALMMLFGLGLLYSMIYRLVVKRIKRNGDKLVELSERRFSLLNEGFGGIKEIIVFGRREYFYKSFNKASNSFGKALGENLGIGQVPRYLLEFFAYGGIMLIVMVSVGSSTANFSELFSFLAVLGFACIKLLPAIQLCYSCIVTIKANSSSWTVLKKDLELGLELDLSTPVSNSNSRIAISKSFEIRDFSFSYGSSKNDPNRVLNKLSMRFPVNKTIGIVGRSGSGKSTLVDCLLGLLAPKEGSFLIDGAPLKNESTRAWLNNIGYVPQDIFLMDSTIRENIAFGIPSELIDDSKVKHAARLANCEEFICNFPETYYEEIGQGGSKLSGGQRQRLGIARALYSDPQVVIFDEATSALDGLSESSVMKSIRAMIHRKTIILVAHRLATVRHCDIIYVLQDGMLLESGGYDELMAKKSLFYKMASEGKPYKK